MNVEHVSPVGEIRNAWFRVWTHPRWAPAPHRTSSAPPSGSQPSAPPHPGPRFGPCPSSGWPSVGATCQRSGSRTRLRVNTGVPGCTGVEQPTHGLSWRTELYNTWRHEASVATESEGLFESVALKFTSCCDWIDFVTNQKKQTFLSFQERNYPCVSLL